MKPSVLEEAAAVMDAPKYVQQEQHLDCYQKGRKEH